MRHADGASYMYGDEIRALMLKLQYCECNMYADNVASVLMCSRPNQTLLMCKGLVLRGEQPVVNVAHLTCVYGLKTYAFV